MIQSAKKPLVVFIVGPTGSGKTEVGLSLAQFFPSEFISADSMQIYKGMDILTDKLPRVVRKQRPYHLLDLVSPSREFNVAQYCKAAAKSIQIILKKKKLPIVVGGTGLYVRSLIHGIFEKGSTSRKVRDELQKRLKEEGLERLYEELSHADPEAAGRIYPQDARRILRALEVFQTTRTPISSLQKQRKGLRDKYQVRVFGLRRDREDLYNRIDRRVDEMMRSGLLDEARKLLKMRLSRSASQCIGLKEMQTFFQGMSSLEEAVSLMKRNSRHLAKRQMTWFRAEPGIEWIDISPDLDAKAVARIIEKKLEKEVL